MNLISSFDCRKFGGAILLLNLLALLTVRAGSQTVVDLNGIIQVQEEYSQRLKSAECNMDQFVEYQPGFYKAFGRPVPAQTESSREHSFWAFKGKKFYTRQEHTGAVGQTPKSGSAYVEHLVYDGDTGSTTTNERWEGVSTPSGQQGMYSQARTERLGHTARPNPLIFGYWNAHCVWIADELKQNSFTIVSGNPVKDPDFGPLIEVEGKEKDNEVNRFWFAPEKGMLAVRSQLENTQAHTTDTYTVVQLKQQDGFLIPVTARREWSSKQAGLLSRTIYTFSDIHLNTVPDSQVELKIPGPGMLWDADTRIRYLIDADGNLIKQKYVPVPLTGGKGVGGFPVRWIFILSCTILLMMLVTFASRARWRRAKSA